MPAKKKTLKKKIASPANKGQKRASTGTRTTTKKRPAKSQPGAVPSAATSRKTKMDTGETIKIESEPSSRTRKIMVTATKVALTTRSRAKRWLQKAGEYLSKRRRVPKA